MVAVCSHFVQAIDAGVEVRLVVWPVLVPGAVLVGGKAQGFVFRVQCGADGLEERRQQRRLLWDARAPGEQTLCDILDALMGPWWAVPAVGLVVEDVAGDPRVRGGEREQLLCQGVSVCERLV